MGPQFVKQKTEKCKRLKFEIIVIQQNLLFITK